jgi:hypothetical protein
MLNISPNPRSRFFSLLFLLSVSFQLLIPSQAGGQTKEILPNNLGENWQAVGAQKVLNPDQWAVLPDSDIYAEYGLQKLTNRTYSKGKTKATVEIFEMKFDSGAFGLFTFHRGSLPPNRRELHVGRHLISIAGGGKENPFDPSLASAFDLLKTNLAGEPSELPVLPTHLPGQGKVAESEKYLVGPAALAQLKEFSHLKDIINFDGGVEAVAADYQIGGGKMSLIIVEYHTPQSATDGYNAALKQFTSLDQSEKDRSILKRIGNYLVKAVNVSDRPETEKILGQIKYQPKVYWSGQKLSDIPIDFRPPDPTAIEAATKTIKVVVRSIFWIGFMLASSILLGLIAGGTYFYWRRFRRRRLGIDDVFGDTGDTLRLNLDDLILDQKNASIKEIGSGKKSGGHS